MVPGRRGLSPGLLWVQLSQVELRCKPPGHMGPLTLLTSSQQLNGHPVVPHIYSRCVMDRLSGCAPPRGGTGHAPPRVHRCRGWGEA